jgi:hypothetical protein
LEEGRHYLDEKSDVRGLAALQQRREVVAQPIRRRIGE